MKSIPKKLLLIIACIAVCGLSASAYNDDYFQQPTKDEIARSVKVLLADSRCPKQVQFASGGLKDPSKSRLKKSPSEVERELVFVVHDIRQRGAYEVSTNAKTGAITEWKLVDGVQPLIADSDCDSAAAIVRRHAAWQKSLTRRGIDSTQVFIDSWASGIPYSSMPSRIVRCLTYVATPGVKTNLYDKPVEGLVCVVNLDFKRVIEFHDKMEFPIANASQDFDHVYKSKFKKTLSPFQIKQNAKNAVSVKGSTISWQGWKLNAVLHPREGLVIHSLRFNDQGVERPIAHRMNLSEMVVPYGDTSLHWWWRNAFDVGEYGVGNLTTSLNVGTDVPENSQTIDAAILNGKGLPQVVKNAIAIYEKDAGILWKHADPFTGENRVRRARELVVMHIATVGNYDYSVSYIFTLDGSIKVDVGLTGILLPKGTSDTTYYVDSDQGQSHGTLVAKNTIAPTHQHFFNFRMDLDVDGEENAFSEIDQWSPPSEENRHGNAIMMDDYDLRYEFEAQRDVSLEKARMWKVYSTKKKSALGAPTSYVLMGGHNCVPYLKANSMIRKRAGFINHHVWCTRFHDNEMFAAGDYPNQSSGGAGLPQFVLNNESIYNKDVVLWYTFGITHQPRPEEWPIMPMVHAGFELKPMHFFDTNPALLVAPK